ncbi:MAG: hypothetical protein ACI8RA_001793 [Chlamydiales bacterium]|jgi:hypothetical protein
MLLAKYMVEQDIDKKSELSINIGNQIRKVIKEEWVRV